MIVEDVFGVDVLVGDSLGLQVSECEGDALDQFIDILSEEQFIGVKSSLEELAEGEFDRFKEKHFLFCLYLYAILEGRALQLQHSIALHSFRPRGWCLSGRSLFGCGKIVVDVSRRGFLGELGTAILLTHY